MFLISPEKLFSFSRYLDFFLGVLVMQKNSLFRKVNVNFKIFNVETWEVNEFNTHVAQFLKKLM